VSDGVDSLISTCTNTHSFFFVLLFLLSILGFFFSLFLTPLDYIAVLSCNSRCLIMARLEEVTPKRRNGGLDFISLVSVSSLVFRMGQWAG
jgi:hypothetical protein